jgi:flagellar biosynthesis protein FlhB
MKLVIPLEDRRITLNCVKNESSSLLRGLTSTSKSSRKRPHISIRNKSNNNQLDIDILLPIVVYMFISCTLGWAVRALFFPTSESSKKKFDPNLAGKQYYGNHKYINLLRNIIISIITYLIHLFRWFGHLEYTR